mgnify:CR=1 FL=1
MTDDKYQELRLKQVELKAAQQIIDELNGKDAKSVYIKQAELASITNPSTKVGFYGLIQQELGLQTLEAKGLIQVLNRDDLLRPGIHVGITEAEKFKAHYLQLFESIPVNATNARIVYSTRTGIGKINGKPFRLNKKSRNRKLFEYLIKNPRKYLSKKRLWIVAGEKKPFVETPDKVIEFNTIVTTLRAALGNISPEYLRLKKTIILYAEVTLTDKSHLK